MEGGNVWPWVSLSPDGQATDDRREVWHARPLLLPQSEVAKRGGRERTTLCCIVRHLEGLGGSKSKSTCQRGGREGRLLNETSHERGEKEEEEEGGGGREDYVLMYENISGS